MLNKHTKSATFAVGEKVATATVREKPKSRSGSSQTELLARSKTRAELDRAIITTLQVKLSCAEAELVDANKVIEELRGPASRCVDTEAELADANTRIEELRKQASECVRVMIEESNSLEMKVRMHNPGGRAMLSGDVPERRGDSRRS